MSGVRIGQFNLNEKARFRTEKSEFRDFSSQKTD